MMESRSFDHFLGWLPGAHGKQAGLTYLDSQGESHPASRLTPSPAAATPTRITPTLASRNTKEVIATILAAAV
jgi:phospholipase C